MRSLRREIVLVVMALTTHTAGVTAQESSEGKSLTERAVESAVALFQYPIRPVVTTVAPGGGIGTGVRYEMSDLWSEQGFAYVEGVVTPRQYWSARASLGFRGEAYQIQVYARARDMKQLGLYGLGNHTSRSARSTFRLRDRDVGVLGYVRIASFTLGGRVASLQLVPQDGDPLDVPPLDQTFTEDTLPGVRSPTHFAHLETFVRMEHSHGRRSRQQTRGEHQITYGHYVDTHQHRYSFRRIAVESRLGFPGFRPSERLTVRGMAATTSTTSGQSVPFYLQETLGGTQTVRRFDDASIGTDGSAATLRGFDSLRFRGPHAILLQTEYRWTLWGPIKVAAFAEAGKVAMKRRHLDFSDLRYDYGASLGVMTGDSSVVRLDAAFGGGEGAKVFVTYDVGAIFP